MKKIEVHPIITWTCPHCGGDQSMDWDEMEVLGEFAKIGELKYKTECIYCSKKVMLIA